MGKLWCNEELAARAKAGNKEAFALLWAQNRRYIYYLAVKYRSIIEQNAFVDLARIENAAMLKLRRDETLKALHYAHFPDDPQDVFGHSPTPLNVVIAAENWEEWIERAAEELRGLENGL